MLSLNSAAGRWLVAGSVLGSGAVFVESAVVNVALPDISRDLRLGIAGLQWVVNAYLLPLSALMLLGGALGDRYARARVFALGCVAFAIASVACSLAPNAAVLIASRVVQGAAGAMLVPNSLALLETAFAGEERGAAIGRWAAWSAVSTAVGPLVGGWLVDLGSWRWVFAIILPFALAAAWIGFRFARRGEADARTAPEARAPSDATQAPRVDYGGAVLATLGLGAVVTALILGPDAGDGGALIATLSVGGALALVAFVVVERQVASPLLPLEVFRSRQFTGANITTLLAYAALGALFFFLMLMLQETMGYSALAAGASLLPINVFMLLVSPSAGRIARRIGARLPMTIGSLGAAIGMLLFTRLRPGGSYVVTVLPAVVAFGIGLSILVAPLTAAVLGAVDDQLAGIASGVNNAVARLAGLLGTAALPLAVGLGGAGELTGGIGADALATGFVRAMWIGAALCTAAAAVAWMTVSGSATFATGPHPHPSHGCVQRARE